MDLILNNNQYLPNINPSYIHTHILPDLFGKLTLRRVYED